MRIICQPFCRLADTNAIKAVKNFASSRFPTHPAVE